jgi:hypothetical protein
MSKELDVLKSARRVATPLVAWSTPDQPATIELICENVGGEKAPQVRWDLVQGYLPLNKPGEDMLSKFSAEQLESVVNNPAGALTLAQKFQRSSLFFVLNAGLYLKDAAVIQAVNNLRDPFKSDRRTLVMLDVAFELPPQLKHDVVLIEEEMPDTDALRGVLTQLYEVAKVKLPDERTMSRGIDSGRGLSAFEAEQVYAMSLRPDGLDLDGAWERKRSQINQTEGLSVQRKLWKLDALGGLGAIKRRLRQRFRPEANHPIVVVIIDEIEKMLAGSDGGDLSGVSADALGVILREMEDNGWNGMLTVGPGGAAKSAVGKALGAEFDVEVMALDTGATKGSLVGESERKIRAAMRVIKGIGGERVFFYATCNKLDALPPPLRRRFKAGVVFFDLPTPEEKVNIWKLQTAAFALPEQELPNDDGWTGAEIRNCCENARDMAISLVDAALDIVPLSVQDGPGLKKLRESAHGRFLSANHEGTYQMPDEEHVSTGPRVQPRPVRIIPAEVDHDAMMVLNDERRRDKSKKKD